MDKKELLKDVMLKASDLQIEVMPIIYDAFNEGVKFEREAWIKKFEEFACLKDDAWFKEWIKERVNE